MFLFSDKTDDGMSYAIRNLELMMIFLWLQRMDQFGDGVIIYVSFTNLLETFDFMVLIIMLLENSNSLVLCIQCFI